MPALHHLAFRTRELERLAAFYRDWLGLREVHDARPRSVWLAIEPSAVLMIESSDPDEPAIAHHSRELFAVRVSVEERALLRTRLLAAGMLESETEHTLYFRDPDGRRVGVSSYPL